MRKLKCWLGFHEFYHTVSFGEEPATLSGFYLGYLCAFCGKKKIEKWGYPKYIAHRKSACTWLHAKEVETND